MLLFLVGCVSPPAPADVPAPTPSPTVLTTPAITPPSSSTPVAPTGLVDPTAVWSGFPDPARAGFAGDLDGDGADDLGASTEIGLQLVTSVAAGGAWGPAEFDFVDPAFQQYYSAFTPAGDVDADGLGDLWVEDRDGSAWLVTGGAVDPVAWTQPGGEFYSIGIGYALQACDLVGDGQPDLLAAEAGGAGAYYPPFSGELTPAWTIERPSGGWSGQDAVDARVGDFDADGAPDVAVWVPNVFDSKYPDSGADGDVYVFSADGTGTRTFDDADVRIYGGAMSVENGDWDGDGVADLILAGDGGYYSQTTQPVIRVVLGPAAANLDSTLTPDVTLLVDVQPYPSLQELPMGSPGDVTGDGRDDLLITDASGAWLYPGGPTGELYASDLAIPLAAIDTLSVMGRGDVDGDGVLDLAVQVQGGVALWLGGTL